MDQTKRSISLKNRQTTFSWFSIPNVEIGMCDSIELSLITQKNKGHSHFPQISLVLTLKVSTSP